MKLGLNYDTIYQDEALRIKWLDLLHRLVGCGDCDHIDDCSNCKYEEFCGLDLYDHKINILIEGKDIKITIDDEVVSK